MSKCGNDKLEKLKNFTKRYATFDRGPREITRMHTGWQPSPFELTSHCGCHSFASTQTNKTTKGGGLSVHLWLNVNDRWQKPGQTNTHKRCGLKNMSVASRPLLKTNNVPKRDEYTVFKYDTTRCNCRRCTVARDTQNDKRQQNARTGMNKAGQTRTHNYNTAIVQTDKKNTPELHLKKKEEKK